MRTSCKRLLTLILAVAMLVGLLPTVALATESHAGNISPEPQKLIPSNYEPDPKFTEFIKGLVGKLRFGVLHSHTAEYSDGAGTLEEVRNRTKQAVKKGKVLLFHWRGGYLTKEVLMELLEIFDQEAKVKDKRARVSVNWSQAVLRVRFEVGLGEEQVEMEEANEGEKE